MAVGASSLERPSVARRPRPNVARAVTLGAAAIVVVLVALLLGFVAWNGIQLFVRSGVGLGDVLGATWQPDPTLPDVSFGLLPFVLGTLAIMVVAVVLSAPLSIGLGIFTAEVAPGWMRRIVGPAMDVFVGIPSVVYGWLGLSVLVPFLAKSLGWAGFQTGFSLFAGGLVLAVMIMPTIAALSRDAIANVPRELAAASFALGTTRWQTIRHVQLPAARAGLLTAVVLGMMRAAGEALAVQMVIGNRPIVPTGLTDPMTTLTAQIALDMGNTVSGEPWNQALWTMGTILLAMSLGFVVLVRWIGRGKRA